MYSLSHYVEAVSEMLLQAKDSKERESITSSWFKLLEKHHRLEETEKIGKIIEAEIEKRKDKITVVLSEEKEKEVWKKYFSDQAIEPEFKIEPKIIGGTKLVWKNLLVDNSISTQLEKAKRRLL